MHETVYTMIVHPTPTPWYSHGSNFTESAHGPDLLVCIYHCGHFRWVLSPDLLRKIFLVGPPTHCKLVGIHRFTVIGSWLTEFWFYSRPECHKIFIGVTIISFRYEYKQLISINKGAFRYIYIYIYTIPATPHPHYPPPPPTYHPQPPTPNFKSWIRPW